MKGYVAWMLDAESVDAVRRHFPGRFDQAPNELYVTCLWNVTLGDPEARMLVGQRKAGAVVGHCMNDSLGIECAVIRGIASVRPAPHIVLSYRNGVASRVASEALSLGPVEATAAFLLAGTYTFVRSRPLR